jgi:hypothetical protein
MVPEFFVHIAASFLRDRISLLRAMPETFLDVKSDQF